MAIMSWFAWIARTESKKDLQFGVVDVPEGLRTNAVTCKRSSALVGQDLILHRLSKPARVGRTTRVQGLGTAAGRGLRHSEGSFSLLDPAAA